ncbi:hypothetical protein [Pseudomonas fragi]|uniref:hypothetical protein n=1 Tax=Pseudomonas fragi TaxID=296 RepID=UPI00056CCB20|nr:hypothetical protein [Pseudomonas fragi]MDE4515121.1 hypothetical protein [Pseudomonas fragi]QPC37538.1 hypothetical protein IS178_10300 [Pseudomonas fragi]SDU15443.1 hypothetical protein SAMN05216594_1091 [Pseudomonas fragi]
MSESKTAEIVKRKVSSSKEERESCNIFPNRIRCYTVDGVINIDFGFVTTGNTIKIQNGVALGKGMAESLIEQLKKALEQ